MIGGTMLLIVQLQRHVWLFTTLWTGASHASLSLNISQSLLKHFFRIPSNHLILCCPLLLLPSIFSNIRVSSSESAVHWNTPWLSLCYKPLTVAGAEKKIQTYPRSPQSAGPKEWTGWGMSHRYSFLCSSLLLCFASLASSTGWWSVTSVHMAG